MGAGGQAINTATAQTKCRYVPRGTADFESLDGPAVNFNDEDVMVFFNRGAAVEPGHHVLPDASPIQASLSRRELEGFADSLVAPLGAPKTTAYNLIFTFN
jgi:hypothetical protein